MPGMKKVTIVELSKSLMKNLEKMPVFQGLLADPRLEIVLDDGRRFLLRNQDKYDIVFLVCIKAHSSYANNLYSKEFFELVGRHLTPQGVLLAWTDERSVTPKTIAAAFKHVRLYAQIRKEVFCIAGNSPLIQNLPAIKSILEGFTPAEQISINYSLFQFSADESAIARKSALYPINEDWKPVSEYYLGLEFKKHLISSRMR